MISVRRSTKRPILVFILIVLFLLYYGGLPGWRSSVVDYHGTPYRVPSFDWGGLRLQHPQASVRQMPAGDPVDLPKVQHDFTKSQDSEDRELIQARKDTVLQAFRRSWAAYRKYAWTWDELMPVSGRGKNTFGGFSASLIDAMDTLWIMGMRDEFQEAVQVVALIDWSNTTLTSVNLFETTIRHLGGLLSAYDLSGEPVLLAKAVELGEMLYVGFDTPNHMPPFWFDFSAAKYGVQRASNHDPSTSAGSLSLEFTRLSQVTGDPKWYDATERVKEFLTKTQSETKLPGMWPAFLNLRDETAQEKHFTIGAQADSVYEYLPKMHALLGGLDPQYAEMAADALDTVSASLLFRPMIPDGDGPDGKAGLGTPDILFAGDAWVHRETVTLTPDMQHLTCFAGGMYVLGSRLLSRPDFLDTAARLTRGCVWAYAAFPTGLMPEISTLISCASLTDPPSEDLHAPCAWSDKVWQEKTPGRGGHNPKGFRDLRDTRYQLRPEAIESVFYMWRATGDKEWRDAAWDMFLSVVNATGTPLAYSGIQDVNVLEGVETLKSDAMESFWFSETLKYFYLIFAEPDLLSLDEWVLNTEAHPFKLPAKGEGQRLEKTSKFVEEEEEERTVDET